MVRTQRVRRRKLRRDDVNRFMSDGEFQVRIAPSLKTAGEIVAAESHHGNLQVVLPMAAGFS